MYVLLKSAKKRLLFPKSNKTSCVCSLSVTRHHVFLAENQQGIFCVYPKPICSIM